MSARIAVVAVLLVACGGKDPSSMPPADGSGSTTDPDGSVDAAMQGPCWPFASSTPRGDVDLGTGMDAYQPMPDEPKLVYGEQGGFHIESRSRIRGLAPGNPADVTSPGNPRTRFRAFWVNTGTPKDGMPINPALCGTRAGYTAAP